MCIDKDDYEYEAEREGGGVMGVHTGFKAGSRRARVHTDFKENTHDQHTGCQLFGPSHSEHTSIRCKRSREVKTKREDSQAK